MSYWDENICKQIKISYQFCCQYLLIIYPVCVSIIIAHTHTTVTINHGFTGEIRALLDTMTTEKSESRNNQHSKRLMLEIWHSMCQKIRRNSISGRPKTTIFCFVGRSLIRYLLIWVNRSKISLVVFSNYILQTLYLKDNLFLQISITERQI